MSTVTVIGASGAHVPVSIDGAAALALAQEYAATVNGLSAQGVLFASNLTQGSSPTRPPHGSVGEGVVSQPGAYDFPKRYTYLTDNAGGPVFINAGNIKAATSVLAGVGGTSLLGGSGGGAFIAGGGNNLFVSQTANSGNYLLGFGNGNDTVFATSGNEQIQDGIGTSLIFLGSGASTVFSAGTDRITAGSGRDTVYLEGSGSTVTAGTGALFVDLEGGSNESVVGGRGADTFSAQSGNSTLTGGHGRGNMFDFTNSAVGGNFTITDFGKAAGNMVGLFGYGPMEVQHALASAKDIAGGSTVQLSDNTTITFTGVSAEFLKAHPGKFQ